MSWANCNRGENPIKKLSNESFKNALGDSAEQTVTKCHVLREVENLYLYGCKVNGERILMGLINN